MDFFENKPQKSNSNEETYELYGPQYAFAVWVTARLILVNTINYGNELA